MIPLNRIDPPVICYWPFPGGTSVVVHFLLLLSLILITVIMCVFNLSRVTKKTAFLTCKKQRRRSAPLFSLHIKYNFSAF